MERQSGILMPIFSLPNKYGIGSFGKEAYDFVDFLAKSKQKIWQILPLVQTGFGNSPYSSVSAESVNPFFISPDSLHEMGLIKLSELNSVKIKGEYIDYGLVYSTRYPLLRKAFSRFDKKDKEFTSFVDSKEARDYALFMAIKEKSGYKPFYEWEDKYKKRNYNALKTFENNNNEEVLFWQFVQFLARKQWFELKNYANSWGVKIMGDMPLYVALDSVDVWKDPSLFKLDENYLPTKVAGVPPDYFSKTGQLWGNPVYDYSVHEKDNFRWWKNRLKKVLELYDYVRIDHFRGLDRFYEVDFGAKDAVIGEWVDVPSEKLFNAIHKSIDKNRIIAEDLGIIDDGVRELLTFTGYPGMKILSFAFNGQGDNLYLPENLNENSVCYTGTHDNDTIMGLLENSSEWDYNNFVYGVAESLKKLKIKRKIDTKKRMARAIIKLGFACKSNLFILPIQDASLLGSEYRINEPGTIKNQNWAVRVKRSAYNNAVSLRLQKLTKRHFR